jgi:hypothetical protein
MKSEIKQLIQEGDARVAAADTNLKSSDDKTISAGIVYTDAKKKVHALGWSWPDAVTQFSKVGINRVNECIRIAADPDPASAAAKAREAAVARMKATRKRMAEEQKAEKEAALKRMAKEAKQNVSTERSVDKPLPQSDHTSVVTDWTAPAAHEIDPVEAIMMKVDKLTTADFVRLINKMTERARQLGIVK